MPTRKQMIHAALAAGCLLGTTPAEARFGKSRGSGGSGASRPRVHDATPVGQDSHDGDAPNPGGGRPDKGPRRPVIAPAPAWISIDGTYVPYYRRYRPHPVATQEPDEPSHPIMVRMGVEGNVLRDGNSVGINLGFEERHWGVSTRFTGLTLNADDGTVGQDAIHLAEAHVTFAPVVGERGRLRMEGGVAAARAPDVTFIGPSMALSFERCLLGPLDLEGRLQWVPLPHLQLDGQAGLAVHLGVLTLRAGWRGLLLDDRGHVDGVVHRDMMGGPFAGLGLSF
ncbi:hypothetical protein JQX13_12660 [Archangium violaceum]|uniref:hypothetical protein n=1 Tax=Archangium violaceum TaxID=83451 RepID=UPI00193BD988|nr:hypothetical protein [Archangium violaceum]QRK10843.1 hypothetical protein JQX13_12660 [Archangium violaceum]